MKKHQSFLVFLLAFSALTLARGQAMAQWDWDWGDLPPGFIDGGSTAFVYHCTQGQGTNQLTLGATATDPDIFASSGSVSCNFTGQVPGNNIACTYDLTFTGDLVNCVNTSAGAVVTLQSTCDNVNGVSGSLSCQPQSNHLNPPGTFPGVTDLLGISSKSECQRLFGRNANTLFTQATYVGQTCNQVLASTTTAGLKFGGLTKTTTNLCHSEVVRSLTALHRAGAQTNRRQKSPTSPKQHALPARRPGTSTVAAIKTTGMAASVM